MKLYFIIAACFALAGSATVTGRDTEEVSALSEAAVAANRCGASESCRGAGDSNLCDDRCQKCQGPSGFYQRGVCGGLGWQRCFCYYS